MAVKSTSTTTSSLWKIDDDIRLLSTLAGAKTTPLTYYQSGVRNVFFRLEAVSRIFKRSVDKTVFTEAVKTFKGAEDALGSFDYYSALYEGVSRNKLLPAELKEWFKAGRDSGLKDLGNFLREHQWLPLKNERILQVKDLFHHAEFADTGKMREGLKEEMVRQLEKSVEGYEDGSLNPHDIEDGLHEIRRKFRWVSIYAQVCNGWVQLQQVPVQEDDLKLYATKEIVDSPFNKLPALPKGVRALNIQAINFYALSYVIAKLGDLKDEALMILAFQDGVKACKLKATDIRSVYKAANIDPDRIKIIPAEAETILDRFIHRDRIPQRIIRDLNRSI